MSFQKCPICEGDNEHCKTCKGSGVINKITGLPPDELDKKDSIGEIQKVIKNDLIG